MAAARGGTSKWQRGLFIKFRHRRGQYRIRSLAHLDQLNIPHVSGHTLAELCATAAASVSVRAPCPKGCGIHHHVESLVEPHFACYRLKLARNICNKEIVAMRATLKSLSTCGNTREPCHQGSWRWGRGAVGGASEPLCATCHADVVALQRFVREVVNE